MIGSWKCVVSIEPAGKKKKKKKNAYCANLWKKRNFSPKSIQHRFPNQLWILLHIISQPLSSGQHIRRHSWICTKPHLINQLWKFQKIRQVKIEKRCLPPNNAEIHPHDPHQESWTSSEQLWIDSPLYPRNRAEKDISNVQLKEKRGDN